jgi:NADH dehydrogenase
MTIGTVALVGGSGFIGSVLANRLVASGAQVRIVTRDRQHARHLWLLPNTEVIALAPADPDAYLAALTGCNAVVNLVGILNERGDDGRGFHRAHVEFVHELVKQAKAAEVARLIHLSALNADAAASSYYLRSKGEAERLLAAEHGRRLSVTVIRPATVFGPHDSFLNRFARLLALAPGVLPLACAATRVQPVYVGDVAAACVAALMSADGDYRRFDIGGPQVLTLAELVRYVAEISGRRCHILELGPSWSRLMANVLEYAPGKPLSRDNVRALAHDVVVAGSNGLDSLGIVATPLAAVVPQYLGQAGLRQRFFRFRGNAGR